MNFLNQPLGIEKAFTIQNVPIKFAVLNSRHRLLKNLQYKMFLLN